MAGVHWSQVGPLVEIRIALQYREAFSLGLVLRLGGEDHMVLVLADERVLGFHALKDISTRNLNGADLWFLMLGHESPQPRMSHDHILVNRRVWRLPAGNDGNHLGKSRSRRNSRSAI
jgi:hypothetical protein